MAWRLWALLQLWLRVVRFQLGWALRRLGAWVVPSSNYVAGQVTLTNANTSYKLLDLIRSQLDPNCPDAAREFNIQANINNAATAVILVGSGTVSATQFAYGLGPADARNYPSIYQNVLIGYLHVFCTQAGQKLGVEVMAS